MDAEFAGVGKRGMPKLREILRRPRGESEVCTGPPISIRTRKSNGTVFYYRFDLLIKQTSQKWFVIRLSFIIAQLSLECEAFIIMSVFDRQLGFF